MKEFLEIVWVIILCSLGIGSCVYLEKNNSKDYQACLNKASNVVECEGVKN